MPILIPLLLCLLLGGCGVPEADIPEAPAALSPDFSEYSGSKVEGYTLEAAHCLYLTDSGYLLVSGEEALTLTYRTEDMALQATAELSFSWEEDTFRLWDTAEGIACYDHIQHQILFLDADLTESRRVTLPQNITTAPQLSSDGKSIYYAIPGALYRWDLGSGIRQRIQELDTDGLTLDALQWEDSLLQCTVSGETRFFHTEDGHLVSSHPGSIRLITRGDTYYACFPSGLLHRLVFGSAAGEATGLYPEDLSGEGYFLPEAGLAIIQSGQELEAYDLDSGLLRDNLTLEDGHKLRSIHGTSDGRVLLLVDSGDNSLLLFWQPKQAKAGESYTEAYFPDASPDAAQWALCQSYARELEERYGISIRIGKEAAACSPWDYRFQPELQTPVILRMLTALWDCLSQFPTSLLTDTAGQFDSLTLCLVRAISGTAGETSLNAATGLQFLDGKDAYIVVAASTYAPRSLCHELFHVMETRILSTSNALDDWDKHNPAGFSYSLHYDTAADRSVYLSGQHRAFVDHYSMSYPKEDRARIFEYAMQPGQADLFSSDTMQEKLQAICTGIREAYALEKYEGDLPWEQYLE